MAPFGDELRRLRTTAGMRQSDLTEALGRVVARSTLANVESGRELPSARLWSAIQRELPDWAEALQSHYDYAREPQISGADNPLATLAGPFSLTEARYVYTFREHRAPEEIVEVKHVRALKDGADGYVLRMNTDGPSTELDVEVLWGGVIEQSVVRHDGGQTVLLHRLAFDRTLRRGETHSFALRSWITKEDTPPNKVDLRYTIPISLASLHLNFLGPTPRRLWRFGPLADAIMATDPDLAHGQDIYLRNGSASAYFDRPSLNAEYGIAWTW
mgnify:CR=1 FL=1